MNNNYKTHKENVPFKLNDITSTSHYDDEGTLPPYIGQAISETAQNILDISVNFTKLYMEGMNVKQSYLLTTPDVGDRDDMLTYLSFITDLPVVTFNLSAISDYDAKQFNDVLNDIQSFVEQYSRHSAIIELRNVIDSILNVDNSSSSRNKALLFADFMTMITKKNPHFIIVGTSITDTRIVDEGDIVLMVKDCFFKKIPVYPTMSETERLLDNRLSEAGINAEDYSRIELHSLTKTNRLADFILTHRKIYNIDR